MATTTRAVLRQRVSEGILDYFPLTTSGTGSSTTIVDASLANLVGGRDNDAFIDWYAMITESGHTAVGEIRRISDYVASTTTITVAEAFSATTNTDKAYELHRWDPTYKHTAIDRAIEELYPVLYLQRRDGDIVVDNLLLNPSFERGVTTNWTAVGSPTVTADTTYFLHGLQSAKIVSGGSLGQLQQDIHPINIKELVGKTVRFKGGAWASAASEARLNLVTTGASTVNSYSDYHAGEDEWESLDVSVTIEKDTTAIKCSCEAAANKTAYFDFLRVWVEGERIYQYALPVNLPENIHRLMQQVDENKPNGLYYPLMGVPRSGMALRLEGPDLLTRPSTDAGTTEVGPPRVSLIVARALRILYRMLEQPMSTEDRTRFLEESARWREEERELRGTPGIPMMPMGAQSRKHLWHIEGDGTSRYLVFDV